MNNSYKIFVVFHDKLNLDYYQEDMLDNYVFINVNPTNDLSILSSKYKIINQFELKKFYPLGKWYTESEVIYNIYKNNDLWNDLDYIGLSQYDIDTTKLNKILMDLTLIKSDHINFQPHLFDVDYDRGVVMDSKKPNRQNGKGINCYDVMLQEYNDFYKTNYRLSDLRGKTINLCSSFVIKTSVFEDMMIFICSIIESGKLDIYDTTHKHRMQGGYLERYYALWLVLRNEKSTIIELDHHFLESVKGNTIINKIFDRLRKWF